MIKIAYKNTFKQAFKFALVGGIGTFVNIGILFFFTEYFQIFYILSEVIAFIVSGIHNYLLDKLWVFKEKVKAQVGVKYVQFLTISVFSLIINLLVLYTLVEYYHLWYIYAEVIAIMFGFLINFFGNKLWTFRIKNTVE